MLSFIEKYWSYPIIFMIIATGIILTIRLKGIQFRKMHTGLKLMFEKNKSGQGEVSSFGALCISLSATIGTGNIVGVATAVAAGGPGALFWMVIVSILGLATKYAEGYLAIRYRKFNQNGEVIGGPFAYIEYGLGSKWKPLAKIFALFGAIAAIIGIGTMTQSNSITDALKTVVVKASGFDKTVNVFGLEIPIISLACGVILTFLCGLVLVGGIKRISNVCELIVPIMAVAYIVICLVILCVNITSIPSAFATIAKMAFNPQSAIAGAAGYTITKALSSGVSRGIFANEAGLGSTPIALATAKSDDSIHEGLISMAGMLITVVICTMTGLAVVITNAWSPELGFEGINIANYAFSSIPYIGNIVQIILLVFCIPFFAFTTIIGWQVYGKKCLDYLTNGNRICSSIYLGVYLLMIFLGSSLKVNLIWTVADVFNSLMAIPNLVGLIGLSGIVSKETADGISKNKINKING